MTPGSATLDLPGLHLPALGFGVFQTPPEQTVAAGLETIDVLVLHQPLAAELTLVRRPDRWKAARRERAHR